MTIAAQNTVGELVTERASRSRIFERFGIDYCCGGKIPLTEACEKKGVELATVVEELEKHDAAAPADETDWTKESLASLCDHIQVVHHDYLREALPRITKLVTKVAAVHGDHRPELKKVRDIFSGLREELESHMMKEEMVLFPMFRELEKASQLPSFHCGSVQNPISVMEHEHDDAGAALAEMNRLTNGYVPPPEACGTYRALLDALQELELDMHVHVHKENSILFPAGAKLEKELAARSAAH